MPKIELTSVSGPLRQAQSKRGVAMALPHASRNGSCNASPSASPNGDLQWPLALPHAARRHARRPQNAHGPHNDGFRPVALPHPSRNASRARSAHSRPILDPTSGQSSVISQTSCPPPLTHNKSVKNVLYILALWQSPAFSDLPCW